MTTTENPAPTGAAELTFWTMTAMVVGSMVGAAASIVALATGSITTDPFPAEGPP